jgi:hypothetical protein
MGTRQTGKHMKFCGGSVRCAQRVTKREVAGKDSRSTGCRGAEHDQVCTKDHAGAVALRAALESAVQLGRGSEVTGKLKWPTLQNVWIRYSDLCIGYGPYRMENNVICVRKHFVSKIEGK